jgi:hypothetical protein
MTSINQHVLSGGSNTSTSSSLTFASLSTIVTSEFYTPIDLAPAMAVVREPPQQLNDSIYFYHTRKQA